VRILPIFSWNAFFLCRMFKLWYSINDVNFGSAVNYIINAKDV
jgi:hypothetical protein